MKQFSIAAFECVSHHQYGVCYVRKILGKKYILQANWANWNHRRTPDGRTNGRLWIAKSIKTKMCICRECRTRPFLCAFDFVVGFVWKCNKNPWFMHIGNIVGSRTENPKKITNNSNRYIYIFAYEACETNKWTEKKTKKKMNNVYGHGWFSCFIV